MGRTHGRFGLEEMVRIKHVDSDRLPGTKKIWWYGYGEEFTQQMNGFLDLMFARRRRQKLQGAFRSAGAFLRKWRL
jgi:hypothetical protein